VICNYIYKDNIAYHQQTTYIVDSKNILIQLVVCHYWWVYTGSNIISVVMIIDVTIGGEG